MWKPIAINCVLLSALLGNGTASVGSADVTHHGAPQDITNRTTKAQEAQLASYSAANRGATGPYCGIYSLFACLNAIGSKVEMRNLVTTGHISSWRGSRAADLLVACDDSGVYAKCFTHLTLRELRESTVPMILHVRSSAANAPFNHWVAFLGFNGAHVRILDAPHPLQELAGAELLAIWDGLGIPVSKEPIGDGLIWLARVQYLLWVIALFCGVYLLRQFLSRAVPNHACGSWASSVGQLVWQFCVVIGSAVIIAIVFHVMNDAGFLRNRGAVADVVRRYYRPKLPEVSLVEMERCVHGGDTTLIDARHGKDYEAGAIPGSVSLPVDATPTQRRNVLAIISTAKQVIVYCQSARCGYADEVARFLRFSGVRHVAIYSGGYREWFELRAGRPRRATLGARLPDNDTQSVDGQILPRIVGESTR